MKINKKHIFIAASLIVIAGAATFAINAKIGDKVVAHVNSKPVYESEIVARIKELSDSGAIFKAVDFEKMNPNERHAIIKGMIMDNIIDEESKKSHVEDSEEYKKTAEQTLKSLRQKLYINNIVKADITDAKLKEKYDQFTAMEKEKEEFKASHILVDTKEEAEKILASIKAGKAFEELAKEFSKDGTKDNGGDLGFFKLGQMVPDFEQAVAKLKINEVSEPVKTEFGWHIIKLVEKRKAVPPSFEEMKQSISDELYQENMQKHFDKLMTDNKVEISDK